MHYECMVLFMLCESQVFLMFVPQDVFMLSEFVHESLRFLYVRNLAPDSV